jgi:hypothetical protein
MTQDPGRIDEAMHDRESDNEAREQHLTSENTRRVPVKRPGEKSDVDLPEFDQDRETEAVHDRERRDMH